LASEQDTIRVEYRVASGNSYKKLITKLTTLLYSIKFFDYSATIVAYTLRFRRLHFNLKKQHFPLQLLKRLLHFKCYCTYQLMEEEFHK